MACKRVHESEKILVISDSQVSSYLVLFYIRSVDGYDDLSLFLQFTQHGDLGIRLKSREYAGSVVVVKELAAKLKVQFAAELRNPFSDMLRLCREVLFIIKSDPHS